MTVPVFNPTNRVINTVPQNNGWLIRSSTDNEAHSSRTYNGLSRVPPPVWPPRAQLLVNVGTRWHACRRIVVWTQDDAAVPTLTRSPLAWLKHAQSRNDSANIPPENLFCKGALAIVVGPSPPMGI